MNINLICTSEIVFTRINQIAGILNDITGPLNFIAHRPFERIQTLVPENEINEIGNPHWDGLDFRHFFKYCSRFRNTCFQLNEINNEIVILLTDIPNNKKYFSASNGKNIFVYTGTWNNLDENKINYAIAHNIIGNIFQSLLGIQYDRIDFFDDIIHKESIGCLNDFCQRKEEILIKLRTGYICDNCFDYSIKEVGLDKEIVDYIYRTIRTLRDEFSNYDRIRSLHQLDSIFISDNGDIQIGNIKINFTLIEKALYIFISTHEEVFTYNNLTEITSNRDNKYFYVFQTIYLNLKFAINKSLNKLSREDKVKEIKYDYNKFQLNQSQESLRTHFRNINKKIKAKLSPHVYNNYLIIKEVNNNISYYSANNNISIENNLVNLIDN